jgi:hypothetical protein
MCSPLLGLEKDLHGTWHCLYLYLNWSRRNCNA